MGNFFIENFEQSLFRNKFINEMNDRHVYAFVDWLNGMILKHGATAKVFDFDRTKLLDEVADLLYNRDENEWKEFHSALKVYHCNRLSYFLGFQPKVSFAPKSGRFTKAWFFQKYFGELPIDLSSTVPSSYISRLGGHIAPSCVYDLITLRRFFAIAGEVPPVIYHVSASRIEEKEDERRFGF